MKLKLIALFVSLLLILIVLEPSIYASNISTDITSNDFVEQFDPNQPNQSKTVTAIQNPIISTIIQIANPILSIIQIIGALLSVVSVAFFGFSLIVSVNPELMSDIGVDFGMGDKSPDAKKKMLNFGRHMLIGSVLLFSSVSVVKIVFKIFLS